jgi:3-hydroxyacyl-[acyl-carrier-protein] dehydratase
MWPQYAVLIHVSKPSALQCQQRTGWPAPLFWGASRCWTEFTASGGRAAARVATVIDSLSLDISAILARLPQRHPFLLVDRVLDIHPGQSIRALKNVTYNEPFFTGHFPSRPLMPGVIVIEALVQTASILSFVTAGIAVQETTGFYLVGLDKARFRKPVMPGDQLLLCAHLERSAKDTLQFLTNAFVGGTEVASAEVMIAQA